MEYSRKRAERVIKAFINCVKMGEYTFEYACLLIEDNQKYGYLTEADKEIFYGYCEADTEMINKSENREDE